MGTATGLTAERMQEIIDATIVDADIIGGSLILTKSDGSTIDAGSVASSGVPKGSAFPGSPTDGDLFIRTDMASDPLYKRTDGVWARVSGSKAYVLETAGLETRTNVAYGLMPTVPDRIQNIVVPTGGKLRVDFAAIWNNSVAGAGRAAIFVGANQIKRMPAAGGAPTVQEASIGGSSTSDSYLLTGAGGLITNTGGGAGTAINAITTGLILANDAATPQGLACDIWVPAGTYDVSIQFKSTSGNVNVKERHLWVEVITPS